MMITDWQAISPALFEKLCSAVLSGLGFKNIQWFGEAGSDKGRDILAEKNDAPVPGIERHDKWMIQCKRYIKTSLSKSELKNLLDSALEHKIDCLLIIITTSVSANLRDWLDGAIVNYPFKAYIWEEIDFRREVNRQKSELLESLPEITLGREPLWMYPINKGEYHFGCNEYDEAQIVVYNVDNLKDAKTKAAEFLKYLKANGFEWWE